jgi:hypothetical protein
LVLTNHHCGFGEIARHSSVEHNYLRDGFWARERNEEIPCEGLYVQFIVDIRDVTADINAVITPQMTPAQRSAAIAAKGRELAQAAVAGTGYEAQLKSYWSGNEFYLVITEKYTDVRLVGTPPDAIGKFGGDTDNWMWPRHTGDFCLFRIYAGPDNRPAPYSPQNKPLQPKRWLKVSTRGVQENDFTMVYGFPARTEQYLTSWGVELLQEVTNPIRIGLRTKRLQVLEQFMTQDEATRLRYADTQSGIANGWKKWIGQNRGLRRLGTVEMKRDLEAQFLQWVATGDADRQAQYATLLNRYRDTYTALKPLEEASQWLYESVWTVGLLQRAWRIAQAIDAQGDTLGPNAVRQAMGEYLRETETRVEQALTAAMLKAFLTSGDAYRSAATRQRIASEYAGSYEAYAAALWARSALADTARLAALLRKSPAAIRKALAKDPAIVLARELFSAFASGPADQANALRATLQDLERLWVKGLREMINGRQNLFPDANFTLRLTYGRVEPYVPFDGARYHWLTTLDGMIEKHDSLSTDFAAVPARLRALFAARDYGPYGFTDPTGTPRLPIAFCASNHTSGGNSGSAVLNARGELIGVNFDRNWEGTMSDVHFDGRLVRNITCDARYILFVIDKYGGAGHLVREMEVVN